MKKEVMLAICAVFLVILSSGCAPQEVPIENVPEPIVEDVQQEVAEDLEPVVEDKDDLEFYLPPDEDSPGWTQTSGPLGGIVIRMILHKGIAYVPEMIACVAKTINNGVSWRGMCDAMIRDIGLDNFNSHTLALDPFDSKTIYVPGHTADQTSMLLISHDQGEHWEKQYTFEKHYDFNHLYFWGSTMYLATRDDGVFISKDKGNSWTFSNQGLDNLKTARFFNFKDKLYLLGAELKFNSRFGGKLYQRTLDDSGWEMIQGLDEVTGIGADENYIYAATWNPDPKIWVSSDGKTFTELASQGLPPGWIGEIVTYKDKIFVSPNGNGIYISKDNGNSFEDFNKGVVSIATREVHVNPNDENEIYVGTWDRLGFYWSKNGGKGYKNLATDISVITLVPDPHDFSRVYLGSEQFVVGTVSKEESSFLVKAKPGSKDAIIKSIAIDPTDSNHILVGIGTETAETPSGEGLWESYDGGESWTRAQGIGNFAVYSIIFHPKDPTIVYASALGGGVYKSTDGGKHFNSLGDEKLKYTYRLAMSQSDPDILVANILIDPKDADHLIVGHHGENVVETFDAGKTWNKVGANEMVPGGVHNYAYCLGASPSFKKFYACTCGRGLFRGLINEKGQISGAITGNSIYEPEHSHSQPHNAEELRITSHFTSLNTLDACISRDSKNRMVLV
ncbi:hypothetical protein HYU40_03015 [Candidatus Woesearchaeota archaeon]|nr:hypothetical protein [Candidatus Woesearchaeota archaeon]